MKTVLWSIMGLAAAVGLARLTSGSDAEAPSWMAILIGLGGVSAAVLLILFAVERFRGVEPRRHEAEPDIRSEYDHAAHARLGPLAVAARARHSLAFVLSFAVGFALMPHFKVAAEAGEMIPVRPASGDDPMFIDGDGNSVGARFYHDREIERHGGGDSCVKCHHMPLDDQLSCGVCHRYMHTASNIFRHDWHANPDGAGIPCHECHAAGQERGKTSAKPCQDCHPDLFPESVASGGAAGREPNLMAPSYYDAMHGLCVTCHEETAANEAAVTQETDKAELASCQTCHEDLP
jgi:hypothetical protein